MGEKSDIQFCSATWNPWQGCTKVSPGCKFCYMYRDKTRYGQDPKTVVRSSHQTFHLPLKLQRQGRREIIFTCSWSDWFIEEADPWRDDAWRIIRDTPEHFYLIFTKRSERIGACLPADWGAGYANVMLVATAENQEMAEKRSAELIIQPARYRGLSLEPLLGPVKIPTMHLALRNLHWLVIGGESGNEIGPYRYRPCQYQWIETLVQQGREFGIPVFVKQLGTHIAKQLHLDDRHGGEFREFRPSVQVQQHIPYVAERFGHLLTEDNT